MEEAQARPWTTDPSDRLCFVEYEKMRSLEYELRSMDLHVLYDPDRDGVWVFNLPVPGSTPGQRETESEMISQVVAKFAMRSTLNPFSRRLV